MKSESNSKKILVLQTRTNHTEAHEQECLTEAYKNLDVQFIYKNTIRDDLTLDTLKGVDAVIVGGSGQYYLSDDNEWKPKMNHFIHHIIEKGIPMLGICFGFQAIALQQGAKIIKDESMKESGVFEMTLLNRATEDPLYVGLPQSFPVPLAHKETIVDLPEHLEILSKSERVACQSFRIRGKEVWGVLYHPEMTKQRMQERFDMTPEYKEGKQDISKYLKDTPEANEVLRRFITM